MYQLQLCYCEPEKSAGGEGHLNKGKLNQENVIMFSWQYNTKYSTKTCPDTLHSLSYVAEW